MQVLLGVGLPIFLFIVTIIVINIIQDKRPHWLPQKLRSWEALGIPEPLRSLAPYDRFFIRMRECCPCAKDAKTSPEEDDTKEGKSVEMVANGMNGHSKPVTQNNGINNTSANRRARTPTGTSFSTEI